MNDRKKTERDLVVLQHPEPDVESPASYEPVPSARAQYANVGREHDTIRDLLPPFAFERLHEPPEPLPSAAQLVSEATSAPKITQTPSGQLLRPGECFKNKYRIVSVLNVGTLARVYHAKQLPAERDVTLKVLLTRYANRPEMRHAMHQEGTKLSSIQHPGIVTIHDIGNDDQGVWIVTEFLDGETSRARLKREKRFTLERAVAFIHQAAVAVAVAHDRKIIHGDLKPENIFLKEDNVKVVDFLTARILTMGEDDDTRDEFAYATAEYAAPECFDQDGDPDARSDIYSLALVFIEFVTGTNPMLPDGRPAADALLRLRQRDFTPPIPAEIPAALGQVLRRALEKKPGRRQQTMLDFAAEIEGAWKHTLDRVDEVQPTWLDRWRPSIAALGAGSLAGTSFGLLAFVLFEAHKLPGRARVPLLDAHVETPSEVAPTVTSPGRPAPVVAPSIAERVMPAEPSSALAIQATASAIPPAAPSRPSFLMEPAARPAAPAQRPPPEPAVVTESKKATVQVRSNPPPSQRTSRPLEISDKPPF